MVHGMSESSTPPSPPVVLEEALNVGVAFVIHEVPNTRGEVVCWAWCRLDPTGLAGYAEVTCTKQDGFTKVDTPDILRLGAVVTKLWC
jgi:hypothetical protein